MTRPASATRLTPALVAGWHRQITREVPRALDPSRAVRSARSVETLRGITVTSSRDDAIQRVRYSEPIDFGIAFSALNSPSRYERTTADIAREPVELFTITASRSPGPSTVHQFGRELRFASGDLVVVPTTVPFVQVVPAVRDITGMFVEMRHLGRFRYLVERPRRPSGPRTPLARATASFVRQFAIDIAVSGSRPTADANLAAIDLITAALAELAEDDRYGLQDDRLFHRQAVLDLIARRYRDPELSPDTIASALHISRRHLYRLFADDETSLAEIIAETRLDAGRQLLENSPRMSVGAAAAAAGFGSATTFRNRFTARYGITPSEFRRTTHRPSSVAESTET